MIIFEDAALLLRCCGERRDDQRRNQRNRRKHLGAHPILPSRSLQGSRCDTSAAALQLALVFLARGTLDAAMCPINRAPCEELSPAASSIPSLARCNSDA